MSSATNEKSAPEQFNDVIRRTFVVYKELESPTFKGKLHISEMQTKMARGMNAEPMYAINVLGPHVWACREEIKKRDAAFFIKKDYALDVQNLCVEHNVDYENAINSIGYMKEAYMNASEEKRSELMDLLVALLGTYVRYKLELAKKN